MTSRVAMTDAGCKPAAASARTRKQRLRKRDAANARSGDNAVVGSPSVGRPPHLYPLPPHPTHNPLTFILSPPRGRGQGEGERRRGEGHLSRQGEGLADRGFSARPRVSLLEDGRGAEHRRVVEAPSYNLKANRKAVAGEAARQDRKSVV